jgi:hypothetical protein
MVLGDHGGTNGTGSARTVRSTSVQEITLVSQRLWSQSSGPWCRVLGPFWPDSFGEKLFSNRFGARSYLGVLVGRWSDSRGRQVTRIDGTRPGRDPSLFDPVRTTVWTPLSKKRNFSKFWKRLVLAV